MEDTEWDNRIAGTRRLAHALAKGRPITEGDVMKALDLNPLEKADLCEARRMIRTLVLGKTLVRVSGHNGRQVSSYAAVR